MSRDCRVRLILDRNAVLGRTFTMIDPNPGAGISSITLSYWKDLRSLHGFAHSQQHRAGWDWWNATVKHMPFMGIMHEVYAIPKGHWENIYVNYRPFGMGKSMERQGYGKLGSFARILCGKLRKRSSRLLLSIHQTLQIVL